MNTSKPRKDLTCRCLEVREIKEVMDCKTGFDLFLDMLFLYCTVPVLKKGALLLELGPSKLQQTLRQIKSQEKNLNKLVELV